MLTTTIDGLWVLQVLSGIEVLAPELGLRPHLPSVETRQAALDHPMAAELAERGVIDGDGVLDEPVLEWLTVIAKRDVALVMHVIAPGYDGPPRRVLLARYAQWWVTVERSDDLVRISAAGTAAVEGAAGTVITDQIDWLCGIIEPAALRPVTLDLAAMIAGVQDRDGLRRYLMSQALDADQMRLLSLATDTDRSAQASMAAVQAGVETDSPTRSVTGMNTVSIVDTPEGRLLYEIVDRGGKKWMIVSPGSPKAIAEAAHRLFRQLPAKTEWYSYRKVV